MWKILEHYDKLPKMSQRNTAMYLKLSQPLREMLNISNIEIA